MSVSRPPPAMIIDQDKDETIVEAVATNEPQVERLHRQLKSRHASMLALGGAIGTGLIIASGNGLAHSGPLGLLISFIYAGSLCYAMMAALGEMAAFLPHQKGFPGHATRFVGPSFGAATGFAYWLKYLLAPPLQFSACATLINFWIPAHRVNNGVWIAIFIVLTGCLQFMPVRFFGEFEFWCSTIKVITLTGLMIILLVIDAGGGPDHRYIGFKTWKDLPFVAYLVPGAVGRFAGFISSLSTAIYSYTGTELVGVAIGEMSNPRRNVARAVRACFLRIVFLYLGSVFCIGLVVPANSPDLLAANKHAGNATASPFVVAVNIAGIRVLPHIINAAALIFVLSAANSDVYVNSRTAFSLASEGNLPKIFRTTNSYGVPYVGVVTTLLFSLLAFTAVSSSAFTVFSYFVSAVSLISTLVWLMILTSHLRFVKACKVHGIERSELPYTSRCTPWLSWWGLVGTAFISLSKGFPAFVGHFNATTFVVNYIALPVVVLAFLVFSYKYKGFLTPIAELNMTTGTRAYEEAAEYDALPERRQGFAGWVVYLWNS